MMNCMGQGFAATEVGGIRIADWALAITYILIGLLFVIGFFAIARTVLSLWRREPDERPSEDPTVPPGSGEGRLT